MKKLSLLAAAFLILSVSACQKDANVAPSKFVIKKVASKDTVSDKKMVPTLDGNPAL